MGGGEGDDRRREGDDGYVDRRRRLAVLAMVLLVEALDALEAWDALVSVRVSAGVVIRLVDRLGVMRSSWRGPCWTDDGDWHCEMIVLSFKLKWD